MKDKLLGKICDWYIYLSPILLYIITKIHEVKQFNSNLYIFLCVSISTLGLIAFIISIFVDVRNMKEMTIPKNRKKLLFVTFAMGIVIYFALRFLI